MTETIYARCESCKAEITFAELDRETPAVCPSCGERIELVSVIEDDTSKGFDPTVYHDR